MTELKRKSIALWAHPRSRSTAMERIIMERGDFLVMHEPFSLLYYVREGKGSARPKGRHDGSDLSYPAIREVLFECMAKGSLYFKDMAYHCFEHLAGDEEFLAALRHSFIVREPSESFASLYSISPDFTLEETGYEKQYHLFRHLERQGLEPVVIDAGDLVADPLGTFLAYCKALEIEFMPEALNWKSGAQEDWKAWEDWHFEVLRSKGIEDVGRDYAETVHNNEKLKRCCDLSMPFYEKMTARKLNPLPFIPPGSGQSSHR